ncbi:hypothetical protein X975_21089, partial [Stegodyphus mimosarum]
MSDEGLKAIWSATDEPFIKTMKGREYGSLNTKYKDFAKECRQTYFRDAYDSDASDESERQKIPEKECNSKKTISEIRYERLGSFEAVPEEFRPTKSKDSLIQIESKFKSDNNLKAKDPSNISHIPLNVTSNLQGLQKNRPSSFRDNSNSRKLANSNSSTETPTYNPWSFPAENEFTNPEDEKTLKSLRNNNTLWESNQETRNKEVSFQDSGLRRHFETTLCTQFSGINLAKGTNLQSQENKTYTTFKENCCPRETLLPLKFEDNSKCTLTKEEQRIWTKGDGSEHDRSNGNTTDTSEFFKKSGGITWENSLCLSKKNSRYYGAMKKCNRSVVHRNRILDKNQQFKSTDSVEFSKTLTEYLDDCWKDKSNNPLLQHKNMNNQSCRRSMKHLKEIEERNRNLPQSHSFRSEIDGKEYSEPLQVSKMGQRNIKTKRVKNISPLVRHEINVIHVNQSYSNNGRFVHEEGTTKRLEVRKSDSYFEESDSDSSRDDYYKFKSIIKKDISWSVINPQSEISNALHSHQIEIEEPAGSENIQLQVSKRAYDFENKVSDISSSESNEDQNQHPYENVETLLENQQTENSSQISSSRSKKSSQSNNLSCLQEDLFVDETKAILMQYGKELSDLILGSERTLDIFLSFYRKWIEMRHRTMLLMEKVLRTVNNYSSKYSTFTNICDITISSAKAIAIVPDIRVAVPAKILSFLSDVVSKIIKSSTNLKDLKIDEFEINRCLQEDIDTTSIVYMYGIQCDQQFQETSKLIEEFYQSIINGTYDNLSENEEISHFLCSISELNPKHKGFYRQLQKCYEILRTYPSSEISKAFLGALDDWTSTMKTIGQLNWRFYTEGFDGSTVHKGWEEVSELLQNARNVPVKDIADKIQTCALALTKEQMLLERAIKRLSEP